MKLVIGLTFTLLLSFAAYAQNEQSPIVQKNVAYKAWVYRSVRDGDLSDLRNVIAGKKLVAVVYFAPWCPNWRHDAPMLEKLYEKYKGNGFEIVSVGEYGTTDEMNANIKEFGITFPMFFESFTRDARLTTAHYTYRTATGDTRKWGSPYYVFIEPASIAKSGDLLFSNAYVINGEMIATDGENFIRQKLGLSADQTKAAAASTKTAAEVCVPDKPSTLKKPTDKP